jgi:hypothetical protein
MAIATIRFNAETSNAEKNISRLDQAISGLQSAGIMPTLDVGNLTASAAQMAMNIARATWEMAEASAQSMRAEASFMRLAEAAGESGTAMVQAMQRASRGTISNTDLMMAANRAMVLGVANSAEEMAALTEAAIIRGRDVGVSAKQALSDLVTGIGRMSPQILDNLGIVGAQQSIEAYAASLGKTAAQLTDVERKQALLNAVLASTQGVELVDDAAASFERMEASIANMQDALGKLFSPAIAAIAQSIADAAVAATDMVTTTPVEEAANRLSILGSRIAWLRDEIASMQIVKDSFEFIDTEKAQAAQTEIDRLVALLADLVVEWNQNAAVTGAVKIALDELGLSTSQLSGVQAASLPAIDAVTQKLIEQARAAREAIAATMANQSAGLRSSLLGMAGDLGATNALNQYKELNAELQKRTELMQSWGYTAEQIEFANAAWSQNQIERIRNQANSYNDLKTAGTSAARSIDTAFQSLESRVSGVMQQSLTLDVGVNPADFLPREDAINENARRLAAIMRDGLANQEWLEEFKAEVPALWEEIAASGDPQGAAARILQRFQDGLQPELLDREAIKERVRRMILGEQSMAAVAGEIAQELATEMGMSLGQVQSTMAGMGLGGNVGGGLASKFMDGIDVSNIAVELTGKIAAVFAKEDSQAALKSSATAVGAFWGQAFTAEIKDNTPVELLSILTDQLLPLIMSALATRSTQTGAS